jgi:hypothetical protein
MPSPLTEEATRIVDAVPVPRGPLEPVKYADALPPRAGVLARLLRKDEIVQAAATYHEADFMSNAAQRRFRRLGSWAAYSGFLAAALGGVVLFLETSHEPLRSNLGLGQFVCLAVSLLCAFLLFLFKPFRTWRIKRELAEGARLRLFKVLMDADGATQGDELPLLPLQLECFRRHLLDDQRRFFARRGPQQHRIVMVWQVAGIVAIVMVVAASLPQVLRLERFGLLPGPLAGWIGRVPLDQKAYALIGLIGGSLQSLLAALTVISPAQRNAEKYREMLRVLDRYVEEDLDGAREDAARGDAKAVRAFTTRVSDDLREEGKEWRLLQEALSELALRQLANQRKS